MSDDDREIELELDAENVEFLEQDHVDADELINAILRAEIAASEDSHD